jgi:hypothetical protein
MFSYAKNVHGASLWLANSLMIGIERLSSFVRGHGDEWCFFYFWQLFRGGLGSLAALLVKGEPNGVGRMLSGSRYSCGSDSLTVCVVDCFTESYSLFAQSGITIASPVA